MRANNPTLARDWKSAITSPFLSCLIAIALGCMSSAIYPLESLGPFIPLALFLMLFPAMLRVDLSEFKTILRAPLVLIVALVVNFLISPLLMSAILHLLPSAGAPHLIIGMTLYAMVPCGGLVPAYTRMLGGNVGLAVTIMGLSLLLSIGIIPLWFGSLIGYMVPVPATLVFTYLACIIVFPLALAVATRVIVMRVRGGSAFLHLREQANKLSGYGLILFLFIMSSLHGERVVHQPGLVLQIATIVLVFMGALFALCVVVGKAFRSSSKDIVALEIGTAAKNNAVALALAYSTFGADVALVNAISGPLVQLPIVLAFIAVRRRIITSASHEMIDTAPVHG